MWLDISHADRCWWYNLMHNGLSGIQGTRLIIDSLRQSFQIKLRKKHEDGQEGVENKLVHNTARGTSFHHVVSKYFDLKWKPPRITYSRGNMRGSLHVLPNISPKYFTEHFTFSFCACTSVEHLIVGTCCRSRVDLEMPCFCASLVWKYIVFVNCNGICKRVSFVSSELEKVTGDVVN